MTDLKERIAKIISVWSITHLGRSQHLSWAQCNDIAVRIVDAEKLEEKEQEVERLRLALTEVIKILQPEILTILLPNEQIRGSSLVRARDIAQAALNQPKESEEQHDR